MPAAPSARTPGRRPTSAASQAARDIRHAVLTGALRGGSPVREEEWAGRLSLSRTPVREAINTLVLEGLLARQGRTAYVFQPSLEDLLDIYDLRLALEPIAARRAAESSDREFVEGLTKRFKAIEGLTPDGDWFADHEDFHLYLFSGSNSDRLCQIIASLRAQSEPYVRFATTVDRPFRVKSKSQHRDMVRAVRRHDGEGMVVLVHEHLQRTRLEVERLLEAGWSTLPTARAANPRPIEGVASRTKRTTSKPTTQP